MGRESDERQEYIQKLRAITNGLFNATHAITGSYELAEYVMQAAILDAYLDRGAWSNTVGFREALMRSIREHALFEIGEKDSADIDWRGIKESAGFPLISLISEFPVEIQRMIVLKYGCGLSEKQISTVTGATADEVRDALKRNVEKLERDSGGKGAAKSFERELARELRKYMNRPGGAAFDPGTMLRAFEQDIESRRPKRHLIRRLLKWIFLIAAILLCMLLFWIVAVLLEG